MTEIRIKETGDGMFDIFVNDGWVGTIYFMWRGKTHKYKCVIDLCEEYEELILTEKEGKIIEDFLKKLASLTGENSFAFQGAEVVRDE